MSLFDQYFSYCENTEPPTIFHRWSLVGCIGAFLGRRFWLPFGPWKIWPTKYVMLVGSPGTRKTVAINLARDILVESGWRHFAASKTRQEKFLMDLASNASDIEQDGRFKSSRSSNIVMENLFGQEEVPSGEEPREVFITAGEFNTFMPPGDMDFLAQLGDLWDWDRPKEYFEHRLKNSKPVRIYQPTVSILGGNTHSGIQDLFPPQSIGQGIMSRIIFVYSEPSGKKITIPKVGKIEELVKVFVEMREKVVGMATIEDSAMRALDIIYRTWADLEDQRFKHYSNRRFTHLLKLTLICAASRLSARVALSDVVLASSLLAFTESNMPKALGEFGKSRHSEAANKLMAALYDAKKPMKLPALWKIVQNDLERMNQLSELLHNLQNADKIQVIKGVEGGFLPKQKALDRKLVYVDYNLLKEAKE